MKFSGSAGREVFTKTRRDPELLEEAKKKRLEVDSAPGKDPEALAKEVLAAKGCDRKNGKASGEVKLFQSCGSRRFVTVSGGTGK